MVFPPTRLFSKTKIKFTKRQKKKLQHFLEPTRLLSPLCCLHIMIIAAQFSVEKSQISYVWVCVCKYISVSIYLYRYRYIWNITLVPTNMAVNVAFLSLRRWNWCVESLHENSKIKGSAWISGLPAFSLGVHKQVPLFSRALTPRTVCGETVRTCVNIESCLKRRWEVGEVSVDGQLNTSRLP